MTEVTNASQKRRRGECRSCRCCCRCRCCHLHCYCSTVAVKQYARSHKCVASIDDVIVDILIIDVTVVAFVIVAVVDEVVVVVGVGCEH